jgi:adhesin/invasin
VGPTENGPLDGELRTRASFGTGAEPSALRIEVDSVWAVITRSGGAVLVDRVRPDPGEGGELRWILDLEEAEESFEVTLELRSGSSVMYRGAGDAVVHEGTLGQGVLHDISVDYVGPTPRAETIEVVPDRLAMATAGQRRTLRAIVLDAAGDTVFRPVEWTTRDAAVASVDAVGEVTAEGVGSTFVVASLDGVSDSAQVVVDPTLAGTTTITADSASLVAGGMSSTTVRVEVRDASGNLVGASAGPVTLATTLGSLSQPVTDNGDGTYEATLTAGTTTGVAVVSGTLDGAAIADTAEVVLRAGPASSNTTTITADSASLVADGVSSTTVRVEVRDVSGNLVGASAGPVTLATTLGSLSQPVTDNGDGSYEATLTAGTNTGVALVSGTLDGAAIADTAEVILRAGPADASTTTITADSASLVAGGMSSTTVRVEVRDASGNLVGASAGPVTLATTLGSLSQPVADNGDGTYEATLTAGTTTGVAVVSGTLDGVAIADTAGVELRSGPPDASTTTITADSASLVADGMSSTTVRVEVRDASGNLVGASAGPVTLATTLGSLSQPVTDNGDGTYEATLTAGTTTGVAVVSGTLDGAAIADTAEVVLRAGPASSNTTTITADSASLVVVSPGPEPAGEQLVVPIEEPASQTLVTVRLFDASGNPVATSGGTVTLATTLGTLSPVTDNQDGTYSSTLTAGTTTGVAVVTGTLAGVPIADTAVVEFREPVEH